MTPGKSFSGSASSKRQDERFRPLAQDQAAGLATSRARSTAGATPSSTPRRSTCAATGGWSAGGTRQGDQCKRSFREEEAAHDPETCAEAFDAQRNADQARGDWIDPRIGRTPFGEYAPVWMKSRICIKRRPSTPTQVICRNHIIPVFGKYGLAAIRPTMVQHWVKDLQSVKGLAPSTIETIYVIFASVMRGAVRDGYIRKTPVRRHPAAGEEPDRGPAAHPGQVLALADAMPRRYAPLVLLGAGAGLRQGEAFGLALDRVDTDDRNDHRRPAGHHRRPSPGPCPAQDFCLSPRRAHACIPARCHGRPRRAVRARRERRAVPHPEGTLLRRDYYNREIWKPALTAVGLLPDTTFHDLRHTFASTALAEGVPISEVSRWLGHKSITTTVDLYGHLVPEASGRARDALDRRLRPAGDVPRKCPRHVPGEGRPPGQSAGKGGESACRPGSVPPLARGDGHPSGTAVADSLVRSTREHRAGSPRALAQADCLSRRPS